MHDFIQYHFRVRYNRFGEHVFAERYPTENQTKTRRSLFLELNGQEIKSAGG